MTYWNLTLLSPGSRQPYVAPERERPRSRPKSLWCDVALAEATHARYQAIRWEDAPHLPALRVTPVSASWCHLDQSLTGVQNLSIRLKDLRLNWVPGAPPMNTLKLTYMLYAALGLRQPVRGLYGGVPQLVYQQGM